MINNVYRVKITLNKILIEENNNNNNSSTNNKQIE